MTRRSFFRALAAAAIAAAVPSALIAQRRVWLGRQVIRINTAGLKEEDVDFEGYKATGVQLKVADLERSLIESYRIAVHQMKEAQRESNEKFVRELADAYESSLRQVIERIRRK